MPNRNIVRVPEVFARIRTYEGQKPEVKTICVLLDSGASASLIRGDFTKKLKHERTMKPVRWQMRGGSFNTTSQCTIQFALPEFSDQKLVTWKEYSDDTPSSSLKYDMIIGPDLLKELKIKFDFENKNSDVGWSRCTNERTQRSTQRIVLRP